MESYFETHVRKLYEEVNKFTDSIALAKANASGEKLKVDVPEEFKNEFFKVIDKVSFSLMEDKDNFYGYFLFQMGREIRFDITTPTAVNFKGAKYVIYFNPLIFLNLNIKQMETTIKHEILHILSMHLVRAREVKDKFSTLATNLAMDIVVNGYLDNLPPYAVTLQGVNNKYSLKLEAFNSFEYYAENIQNELDLLEESDEGDMDDSRENEDLESEFNAENTHDIWEENNDVEESTLKEFTEKVIARAEKGVVPDAVNSMINALRASKGELPWNLYLKKLMGTVESNKKKTITRRNRRQPSRLDLRGELRSHKAEIAVAIDISGSISDEEFKQAVKEVLAIVKNYNHEITIIECDDDIRQVYKAKTIKDVKERTAAVGGTKFTPVFKYANNNKVNLLVYFTDGKGEEKLDVIPRGYRVLWVITGRGNELSLKQPHGAVKKLKKVEVKENLLDLKDIKTDGYSMNAQQPMI